MLEPKKYNIAWFKLAEFVARKEKERALAIYRLLSHSLNDEAFANLLQGDLLLSFQDNKAIEFYIRAAQLYEKSLKFHQAAAVYENIVTLNPYLLNEYANKILQLYCNAKNNIKLKSITNLILEICINNNNNFWDLLDSKITEIVQISYYIILHYFEINDLESSFNQSCCAIDFIMKNNEIAITDFMIKISSLETNLYEKVKNYLVSKWNVES